jgi:peptidoglycan L-alanyl-D-glutamate endopeptidase CwlK
MGHFGTDSLQRLQGVHEDLIALVTQVVEDYDCIIHYNGGHRDKTLQDQLYPTNTKVKFPFSYHNCFPSLAVDVGPYYLDSPHIRWNDRDGFYHFAGYVRGKADSLGIPIVWGGDWNNNFILTDQSFYDLVHFQLDINRSDKYAALWQEHLDKYRGK